MAKILTVATNASPSLHGKPTGLWLSELTHFLEVIVDAGFDYDLASPLGGKIPIDERRKTLAEQVQSDPVNARFMADPTFTERLQSSLKCADVDPANYVAFDFRQSAPLQRVITGVHAVHGLLSGVCHGVSGFLDSVDSRGNRLVASKRVTGFSNFEDTLDGSKRLLPFLLESELKRNGANYRKNLIPFTNRVEVDGALITGQNPQSARSVGRAVVAALSGQAAG